MALTKSSPLLRAAVGAVAACGLYQARSFVSFAGRSAATSSPSQRQLQGLRRAEVVEAPATSTVEVESYEFQAEVGKVMDIIVNSLYSNKDVFLRELVSNAADACDKKRFLALTESDTPPEPMKLRIRTDKDKRLLIIEDNGVGMTKSELIDNLGRIARSGTANFVKQMGQGEADVSLIGQFGVGFYSCFLVANKIEVVSTSFKETEADRKPIRWVSEGSSFTIQDAPEEQLFGEQSGTKLILHLKEEAQEYLDSGKLSDLLKKYSEFITFP
eukprot:CAMPEP_0183604274 /NCGR_PEP_ID=MMETSP0371-20130417/181865_1 /TAXON_ID=268820 /ORGANISM="Peridinium aciculiferum, Strain PAER-2" /LENGTH=271 /DNA_ID=CAMNT_0025816371 /DNA_START=10 /DNA_END=821 /DNA_ORIENTATION=-